MNENPFTRIDGPHKCGLNENYLREIETAFARLASAPGTAGFIYSRFHDTLYKYNLSGRDRVDRCPPTTFFQVLYEFGQITAGKLHLPDSTALTAIGEQKIREGVVPIALFRMPYQQFSRRVLRMVGDKMKSEPASLGLDELKPEDVLHAEQCFIATPLFDHSVTGGNVTFALDDSWSVNGSQSALQGLAVDFDDGEGFKSVASEGLVHVHYRTTGTKTIHVKATFEDTVLESVTEFSVTRLDSVPVADGPNPITSDTAYNQTVASGNYWVWLATGHTSIITPYFVCVGFNPANSITPNEIYQRMSDSGLAAALSKNGYDVVILDLNSSTIALQANAFLFSTLVRTVNAMPTRQGKGIAAGISMGTLIVRYALCYMIDKGQDPQLSQYISFDGPHNGAVVPPGVQYVVSQFATWSDAARQANVLLTSTAVRQMLAYVCTKDSPTAAPSSDRATFLAELAAMKSDFPTGMSNYAIGNGSKNGTGQGFAPGAQLLASELRNKKPDGAAVAWIGIWALSDNNPGASVGYVYITCCVGGTPWTAKSGNARALDSCPGSTNNAYLSAIYSALSAPAYYQVQGYTLYAAGNLPNGATSCMVPSVSSVAYPDSWDPAKAIAGSPNAGRFTDFYLPDVNQAHTQTDANAITWIISKLPTAPVAAERGLAAAPAQG